VGGDSQSGETSSKEDISKEEDVTGTKGSFAGESEEGTKRRGRKAGGSVMDTDLVFRAEYKGHKMIVRQRNDLLNSPWEALIQFKGVPEGKVLEPLGDVVPSLHSTLEDAMENACESVTMFADGDRRGKTCKEAGIVWKG
jgi:hypothetical protein